MLIALSFVVLISPIVFAVVLISRLSPHAKIVVCVTILFFLLLIPTLLFLLHVG